jgi:uncharacterized alkaline shock family protein YloU
MNFWARLTVMIYVTCFVFIAVLLGLLALNQLPFEYLDGLFQAAYHEQDLRVVTGLIAIGILLINYIFFKIIAADYHQGRTLAFDNPSGRVTVSVNALVDLVRRVMLRLPEVKNVRATIKVMKKKLLVRARLTLKAEVNIPEMTSNLQELVKSRIQDTISIEDTVEVRIHLNNIIPAPDKIKKGPAEETVPQDIKPSIPFRGYRP